MLYQTTTLSRHTCLPPACEAAFLEPADGLGCVADVPKAQVTLETRHHLLFVFILYWVHEQLFFFLTWAQQKNTLLIFITYYY